LSRGDNQKQLKKVLMKTEKRKHLRLEIPGAYIQYKQQGARRPFNPWSTQSDLINISRVGLCFVDNDILRIGDKLVSQLFLPNGVCWPLKGEVIWKANHDDNKSAVGVAFDSAKNTDEFEARGISTDTIKKIAALHNAAHIVMAHCLGFSTEYAKLFPNGNGEYKIDFAGDTLMAVPLMIGDISPTLFSFYHDKPRSVVENIARHVCHILLSGDITESITWQADFTVNNIQIRLSASDLARAAAIAEHFSIDLDAETKFLYACLKDELFWTPIAQLAKTLLANESRRVSSNEIQQVLLEWGLWKFLAD